MAHYLKKPIQNQVKFRISQEVSWGREHLAKNLHIFPWCLGHGTHSKRILDGEMAWKKNYQKDQMSGIYYTKIHCSSRPWRGSHKSLHLFHPPSASQYHEPSRRASPQLISAWDLHTASPTALFVGWASWPPTNTLLTQDTPRDEERPSSPPRGAPAGATGSRFIPQPLD